MKRRLGWVALCLLVAGFVGGCGSSFVAGGGEAETDSGAPSDPSLPVSPVADALLQHAVHVMNDEGESLADAPILVSDRDGGVYSVSNTDGDGKAVVEVPEGGSVSVFESSATELSMRTVVDPPQGASIQFPVGPLQAKPAAEADTTTYEVTIEGQPYNTKYAWVSLDGRCDVDTAGPYEAMKTLRDDRCAGVPNHRIIAMAVDDDSQVVAWGETMVSSHPGWVEQVAITLNQTGVSTTSIEVSGMPDNTQWAVAASTLYPGWGSTSKYVSSPYSADFTFLSTLPNLPDLQRVMFAGVCAGSDTEESCISRNERFDGATQPATWAFKADEMSWVLVSAPDMTSPARPAFTWATVDPEDADYIQLSSTWAIGAARVGYDVVMPPSHGMAWQFPELPEELSAFHPYEGSVLDSTVVSYAAWGTVDDYTDVVSGIVGHPEDVTSWRAARTLSQQP